MGFGNALDFFLFIFLFLLLDFQGSGVILKSVILVNYYLFLGLCVVIKCMSFIYLLGVCLSMVFLDVCELLDQWILNIKYYLSIYLDILLSLCYLMFTYIYILYIIPTTAFVFKVLKLLLSLCYLVYCITLYINDFYNCICIISK